MEEQKALRFKVQCVRHPNHAKWVYFNPDVELDYVEVFRKLMDGSSTHYMHQPGETSPVGICCVCQGPVECSLTELIVLGQREITNLRKRRGKVP